MLFSSLVSFFALAAVGVNAHGYVDKITVNGKTYQGPIPGETNPKSPIRRIKTINPYKQPGGAGITCGEGAANAAMVVPATAGTNLDLTWVAHPNQKWPHEMGPLITYMAKVPAGQTADKFNAAQGSFFKIQQTGQEGKGWAVAKLMKLGTKYTVAIPKGIENGDYIMRHEIIALHLANQKGGAEFYSSCFQLRVTGGSGTIKPSGADVVKFPGAYTATNPGIFTPKVFDGGFKYQFPGPKVISASSTGSVASTPSNSTTTTPTPDTTEDDCTDEEPTSSSAPPKATPTKKAHARAQAAARGWMSRMEKRYVGAPAPASE
ncbi:hypothetical protein BDV93DRAFT_494603 [Ceratobasidium sp. AG-I]|nr:hypothetical protein BDV93DRAFT_494603 [Ceratobasidium sp. AG-I]